MLIDCDSCAVRGTGCADCLVTALLERDELLAIEMLARAGFEVSLVEPPAPAPGRRLRILPNQGRVA